MDLFCGDCGAALAPVPGMAGDVAPRFPPEDILEQISSLKVMYHGGELDRGSYMNILEKSVFIDGWNRIWSVGANSLNWYRYDRSSWVHDSPVGSLQISSR